MANSPKRNYWDACTWIALIQKESIPQPDGSVERRYSMAKNVIESAKKGGVEIVTSTLSLAEVCKHPELKASGSSDKIGEFFENDYILVVNVDTTIGEKARELMMGGFAGLKPPDAIHLATALLIPGVEEFHTFDAALLKLDGLLKKTDGEMLKICKPDSTAPEGLFAQIEEAKGDDQPQPQA